MKKAWAWLGAGLATAGRPNRVYVGICFLAVWGIQEMLAEGGKVL